MARADKSRTRGALELMDYHHGDMVDIWMEPSAKDMKGWRGPAEIASVNTQLGNVSVRVQGRTLDRQRNEVREHIHYLMFISIVYPDRFDIWLILKAFAEGLPPTPYEL